MSNIVQVSSVSKAFLAPDGRLIQALKNVSLNIPAGRFTTLLGPSGCGKTTLLRLIGGFEEPEAGDIEIDGVSMDKVPANKRPTNTVFQHYGLFPHMTVAGNVAYGMEIAGVNHREITKRVAQALDMVRLPDFGNRAVSQLSGGQQQRVALARAIVLQPKVLLLDEPMAALDRKLRKEMQAELKRLQHELGIAFLCVTHDQEEALSMSDLVVVMNQGLIEQMGTPRDIYDKPRTEFAARFVGEVSLFKALTKERARGQTVLETHGGARLVVNSENWPDYVQICVRPEKWRLPTSDVNEIQMTGDVVESTYLGGSTRLELVMTGGERLVANLTGQVCPIEGETVTLACDPADFHVLAD